MGAPKGNQFWKLRSKHGRDKIFNDPAVLWEQACEYFQWCDDNPLIAQDFIRGGDMAGTKIELNKMRPYTIEGLTAYLDVNTLYFTDFEKGLKDKTDQLSKDFSLVVTRIRETIRRQKFEGAASGFFNATIIARDLGLQDKKQIEIPKEQPLFPDVNLSEK